MPELGEEAYNLIIKEYKLNLLDPPSDEAGGTQGGLFLEWKRKRKTAKKLIAKPLDLWVNVLYFIVIL